MKTCLQQREKRRLTGRAKARWTRLAIPANSPSKVRKIVAREEKKKVEGVNGREGLKARAAKKGEKSHHGTASLDVKGK